jgi:hypothetical protein
MSEAWAVEGNDAMGLGRQVDKAARIEILDHAPIAVQQHQGISSTTLYVVEPNPVYFQKSASRRIVSFGLPGELSINDSGRSERDR